MQLRANDIKNEIDGHREFLYRYALIHVRDRETAEDLVQEASLAAVESADRFRGSSSLRTWLIAILRHKIIDHVRKTARNPAAPAPAITDGEEDAYFDARGHWGDECPQPWHGPEQALTNAQFWDIFQTCCDLLPLQTAQVFLLREVIGFSIEEICKDLHISASNCSVILYRARLRLRRCLEHRWFAGAPRWSDR